MVQTAVAYDVRGFQEEIEGGIYRSESKSKQERIELKSKQGRAERKSNQKRIEED